jgi:hypothetical protein
MKKKKIKEWLLLVFLYAGLIFQETETSFESSCCMLLMMREVRGIWNFGVLLLGSSFVLVQLPKCLYRVHQGKQMFLK